MPSIRKKPVSGNRRLSWWSISDIASLFRLLIAMRSRSLTISLHHTEQITSVAYRAFIILVELRRIELRSHPCHGYILAIVRQPHISLSTLAKNTSCDKRCFDELVRAHPGLLKCLFFLDAQTRAHQLTRLLLHTTPHISSLCSLFLALYA